jgi:spore coat polysaccharide biosynthesis predicted glycosyltransferase SpsG
LGGVDKDNLTCRILKAIELSDLPNSCRITVVMGATAPWVSQVERLARTLPYDVEVAVNVSDMAARMSQADLAIGAAGSTSWERCCLGLPTLMLILADNQTEIANHLERAGASSTLNALDLESSLISALSTISADPKVLNAMSKAASSLVDGKGVQRLVNYIYFESVE